MRARLLLALFIAAPLSAATIAENGLLNLGDRGGDAIRGGPAPVCRFQLAFKLAEPTRVWVEAEGLQGLHRDSNAAPEVFLDDAYLGPLRVEHGGAWRSPRDLQLAAGRHVLELRCAAVGDADDVSLQKLRVLSEGPAAPKAKAAPKPAAKGCSAPTLRKDWPKRLGRGGLTLSVLSGREADSKPLHTLKAGEAWALQARVPADPQGGALALNASMQRLAPGRWKLLFHLDPRGRDRNDPVGYRPGQWEPLRFQLCDGQLRAEFAQAGALQMAEPGPQASIEIAAQDLELGLKPAP